MSLVVERLKLQSYTLPEESVLLNLLELKFWLDCAVGDQMVWAASQNHWVGQIAEVYIENNGYRIPDI